MRRIALWVMLALALTSCGTSVPSSGVSPSSIDGAGRSATSLMPDSFFESGPSGATVSSVDPIGVGITRIVLIDPTRSTAPRPPRPGSTSRTLARTVRYPVDAPASSIESSGADPHGQWPLLVFAHGFDVSAETYAPLLHAIASFGFVVVAPEFPLSSSTIPAPAIESDLPEQARDVNFLIDQLTGPRAPAPIGRAISPGPVGVMGHSDGAQTVLLSGYPPAYRDRRIGAVVAVSGRYSTFGGRWFGPGAPPLLVVQASADELNPFSSGVELIERDPYPAMLVAVDGVTHLGAVADPTAVTPVARMVADMLAWRLRSDPIAQQRVDADASQWPLRLVSAHGD